MTKEVQVPLSHKRKIIILTGIITGSLAPTFYSFARGNALPSVLAEFGGMQFYALCSIVAVLTMAVCTPISGRLGAMFGKKPLYTGGLVVFCVSLLGCATAANMWLYILFIALSGAAQGFISAFNNAIIADVVTAEERPKYVSYNSTASTVVQLAGPLLSGVLVDQFGWRAMFLAGVPFPIIAFLLMLRFWPDAKLEAEKKQRIDVWGAIAFLCAVVPLLVLPSLGGTMIPWGSSACFGLLAVSVVFAVILVRVDTRHEAPMISFYMFKNRNFLLLLLATFLFGLGNSMGSYLPYYFQNVVGMSASLSGTLTTPRSVATMIATALVGAVMSKTGKYKQPLLLMLGLSVASYAAMGFFFTPTTGIPAILAATTINGLGNTAMIVAVISISMMVLSRKDIGVGVALITFVTSLAGSLGNAIGGLLTNGAWSGIAVPEQIQAALTPEQLGQFSSASILKNQDALDAIRVSLPTELTSQFDSMIASFRETLGRGVDGLFLVMAAGCLAALILVCLVKLPKKE